MTKFITVPNPILRKKSKPVGQVDKKLLDFIKALKKALVEAQDPPGVGLSAVQIGKPIRVFVARKDTESEPNVFINPEISWRSKKLTDGIPDRENKFEGCLSVPGYYGLIQRARKIKLKYSILPKDQSASWQTKTKDQVFSGFLATVIQHEMDHLNGILFIDRILEQGNQLYKAEEGELLEIEL